MPEATWRKWDLSYTARRNGNCTAPIENNLALSSKVKHAFTT